MSIAIAAALVAAGIIATSGSSKKQAIEKNGGKIPNDYVKFNDVVLFIKNFKPTPDKSIKTGFSEKSIEEQLFKSLKTSFVEVARQYKIKSLEKVTIDIDVADGKAGIEIKMARELKKTNEYNRAIGQLHTYSNTDKKGRYYSADITRNTNNVIFLICGSEDEKNDAIVKAFKDCCKKGYAEYIYLPIEYTKDKAPIKTTTKPKEDTKKAKKPTEIIKRTITKEVIIKKGR